MSSFKPMLNTAMLISLQGCYSTFLESDDVV
ncbi:hypothetical protein P609_11270 [Comamonas thiooxydans]|nr:hypothetical protein P609_11270 [Comamonas thiooxydans]